MNSKGILVCIVMAFLLFAQIQGLTVKFHQVSKNTRHYKVQGLAHKTFQHVKQIFLNHLDQEDNSTLSDLIANDPELLDSAINGKPLSESGAQKIKDFFLSDEDFKTAILSSLGQDECGKILTDAQKDKIIKIMVDQMPIANIFVADSKPDQEDQGRDQFIGALLADQELGPILAKCDSDLAK